MINVTNVNSIDCFQSLRKPAKKGVWPEEEVEQLRTLYEEYKNSEDEGNILGFGKVVPMAARRFVNPPLIYSKTS